MTRFATRSRGDVDEIILQGGLRYTVAKLGLDVRADRAVLVIDRGEAIRGSDQVDSASGLPRRSPTLPASRRALDSSVIRDRLLAFLDALRGPETVPPPADIDLELFRSVHLEGDVAIIRDGVEVVRAAALTLSLVDDRLSLDDVVLRIVDARSGQRVTLKAPRLVRQRGRFVGRDVRVSASRAGKSQFELVVGEIEILQRATEFEIRSRDNTLAIGGRELLPLPDQTWFSSERPSYLIRGVEVGTSSQQGIELGVAIGSSWNDLGGKLHEALTGESREKFRGDWELDTLWIEKRGLLLRPDLTYRGGELYEGFARGVFLDDAGENIRAIRRNLDGTLIDNDARTMVRTENRVRLDEFTTLDLTLFESSDGAVLSEFSPGEHIESELPETSVHLRRARDNHIGTLTGRWNLNSFQYGDNRDLTDRFVEEEPRATYDVFSASLLELPFDTELLLSSSTDVGRLRSAYDPTSPLAGPDDETWRLGQELELAIPFRVGPMTARGWSSGQVVWYENANDGNSEARSIFAAGFEVGTRVARRWGWMDDDGSARSMSHVLSPSIGLTNTFAVDGDPGDFPQFDSTDALQENTELRVGLLQRLLYGNSGGRRDVADEEVLWLDLAQNFAPISDRDNGGDQLGVFEFEAILRPVPGALTEKSIQLMLEGEHVWRESELRTFNSYLQVPTGDVTWLGEYREDRTAAGQLGFGTLVPIRQRWEVFGRGLYDLERSTFSNYTARLTRIDTDWRLSFAVVYDVISDNVTFRVDFLPTFGGLGGNPRIGGADFNAGSHGAY